MITSVENSEISKLRTFLQALTNDIRSNTLGFSFIIVTLQNTDFLTNTELTPELFFKDMRVVANDLVSRFEDTGARAIVLFQFDDL